MRRRPWFLVSSKFLLDSAILLMIAEQTTSVIRRCRARRRPRNGRLWWMKMMTSNRGNGLTGWVVRIRDWQTDLPRVQKNELQQRYRDDGVTSDRRPPTGTRSLGKCDKAQATRLWITARRFVNQLAVAVKDDGSQ